MASVFGFLFFFNDTATTEIYTLSLHDALPILLRGHRFLGRRLSRELSAVPGARPDRAFARHRRRPIHAARRRIGADLRRDRKSTRLNSSHANISYAVFCLKKKNRIERREDRKS